MSILEKLRELYPHPAWAFLTQVRSATGAAEDLRIADAMAVHTLPGQRWRMILFEEKASRGDLRRELRTPEKAKLAAHCEESYLVVPAPRKLIIPDLREVPRGWGLIEVGTGSPVTIVESERRETVVPPSDDLLRSIIRSACALGQSEAIAEGAPIVAINRPGLSRTHVGLECGHAAPMPLAKKMPAKVPCFSCAKGLPPDVEVVEAMVDDAEDEDLMRLAALVQQKLEERGLTLGADAAQ